MKNTLNFFFIPIIFAAVFTASYGSALNHFQSPELEKDAPMIISEPLVLEEQKTIGEVPIIRTSEYLNLTFEEMELLEQIAMAEARGEGSKGMALVMRVVLNRSRRDGMSVRAVIYAPNQFYTAGMEPGSEECHEALAMVMDGWDESQGACYFQRNGYSPWGEEALFKYGNHYFSK